MGKDTNPPEKKEKSEGKGQKNQVFRGVDCNLFVKSTIRPVIPPTFDSGDIIDDIDGQTDGRMCYPIMSEQAGQAFRTRWFEQLARAGVKVDQDAQAFTTRPTFYDDPPSATRTAAKQRYYAQMYGAATWWRQSPAEPSHKTYSKMPKISAVGNPPTGTPANTNYATCRAIYILRSQRWVEEFLLNPTPHFLRDKMSRGFQMVNEHRMPIWSLRDIHWPEVFDTLMRASPRYQGKEAMIAEEEKLPPKVLTPGKHYCNKVTGKKLWVNSAGQCIAEHLGTILTEINTEEWEEDAK